MDIFVLVLYLGLAAVTTPPSHSFAFVSEHKTLVSCATAIEKVKADPDVSDKIKANIGCFRLHIEATKDA
jgi:hypothetical protein